VGDLGDLADLAAWSAGEHEADFVLANPMYAVSPGEPMEPSPYLPTTRRFGNPLYLRVEHVPEYAQLDPRARTAVDALRARLADEVDGLDRIERDACWRAKGQALAYLYQVERTPGRDSSYRSYLRRQGRGLEEFVRWCAIAEVHGASWSSWPEELRDPRAEAVDRFASEHAEQIDFQRWLQWQLDQQLEQAQAAARRHGMAVGVMHDLAVGVQVSGADAWRLQDVYAQGVTVGAPPDAFSQAGQNWSQPPWRPDRLAEAAYEPLREVMAGALAHGGGLRVDHVAGLFRLWWVPDGASAAEGTYVRYDHEAMVGILALEAHRAGAVVVGEDVGVVEPWVRDHLRDRGMLGTSILWFERDYDGDGRPLPPQRWRELCLASVTTHDLPPTAGYLADDHVRLRSELGMLTRSLEEELAESAAERELWLAELRRLELVGESPSVAEIVDALHRFLALTPARLRCLSLTDAVGDRRTQNQPGSVDEYPNWRVPMTDAAGRPVGLEDVFRSPLAAGLIAAVRGDESPD
jgi:4-alpha-glucanotransferase